MKLQNPCLSAWKPRLLTALTVLAAALLLNIGPAPDQSAHANARRTTQGHRISLPLFFEPNGDTYLARGAGYGLLLESGQARLALSGEEDTPTSQLAVRPMNSNPNPEALAEERLPGRSHYYIGNDPSRWRNDVPMYGQVRFREVYDGVDLVYYGTEGEVEFDFEVAPGANPDSIELSFDGARHLELDENGDLLLSTPVGTLRQRKPVAYQEDPDGRTLVAASYLLTDDGRARFDLGAYDPTRTLVVDPILAYSSFVGGNGTDWVNDVVYDPFGNLLLCGGVGSTTFPTGAQLPAAQMGTDAFVLYLDGDNMDVIYRAQIGGSGDDVDYLYCDFQSDGTAVMTGLTEAADFPLLNPIQNSFGGDQDVFVARFDLGGNLLSSTYVGGNSYEGPGMVKVGNDDTIHVAGWTASSNFPLRSPYQSQFGGDEDGFFAKLSPSGSALMFSTYFGGSGLDYFYGVAVDSDGAMYGSGYTESNDFPVTAGAFQPTPQGDGDAFAAKFSPGGSSLEYSTYLGGSGEDWAVASEVDFDGSLFVGGNTYSNNFPVFSIQSAYGGNKDVFLTKLNPTGTGIVHSTYLGGSGEDGLEAIDLNQFGEVYLGGSTYSDDFPLAFPEQDFRGGGEDVFLTKINEEGTNWVYSTYFGGPDDDDLLSVATDWTGGKIAVAGWVNGSGYPVFQPAQAQFGGGDDGFLAMYVEALVTSSANYFPVELAPDMIGVVFGADFTDATIIAGEQPPPNSLGGITVTITDALGDLPCPLFYVVTALPDQIAFLVPSNVELGPAILTVATADGRELRTEIQIYETAPGLYAQNATGAGPAAANVAHYHNGVPTFTLAAKFNGGWTHEPIDLGPEGDEVYLFLYGTGIRYASTATVTVGGIPVGVFGPVAQGEYAGLDQMNIGPLPRALIGRGVVNIDGEVDGLELNTLTVEIQ